jgi:sugar lactone lactonase YvrE
MNPAVRTAFSPVHGPSRMTHPDVHPHAPRVAVASGCALGEGPVWDRRTGTLLWVDIKAPAVWRLEAGTGAAESLPVQEPVGFVALTQIRRW